MMAMIPALMIKTKINSNKIKKEAKAHFLLSKGTGISENELFDITTIPIVGAGALPRSSDQRRRHPKRGESLSSFFACVFG